MRLIDELKRRYGTPENVLAALGLDTTLLDEEPTMAMDQSPAVENCLAAFRSMLGQLNDADRAEFATAVLEELQTEPGETAAAQAEDARRRFRDRFAADGRYAVPRATAPSKGFEGRFPSAARIRTA